MKKFIVTFMIIAACSTSYACDICGCGGGNFYLGLLPNFNSKFIGLRYQYLHFYTRLSSDPSQFSHNYYHITELWGGWNLGKKWQLLGFIPYYLNKQIDDDGTAYKNGLGDVTLLLNYQLLHSRSVNKKENSVEQLLWLGGGLKLPSGSFRVNPNDSTITIADINAQIGTGSTDFLINALYNLRIGMFGVNSSLNYKLGTPNSSHYKFGNKFTASTLAYYRLRTLGMSIAPNAGILYERTQANTLNKEKVRYTGSYALSAMAGVELTYQKITLGISAQLPFAQNFAENQTKMLFRGMAHVTFAF